MQLVRAEDLSLSYSGTPLLDKAGLIINSGEKICLVGRNGTGKSTLLKIILDEVHPDGGTINFAPGIKVSMLSQSLPEKTDETVYAYVAHGLSDLGQALEQFNYLTSLPAEQHDGNWEKNVDRLQKLLDSKGGWEFEYKIQTALTRLNLVGTAKMSALSGGWRRKVALARALVAEPDILLLDEPSNHLDLESIQWLEQQLLDFKKTLLCISHDRVLVDNIATRIIELDRGNLTSYPGNFSSYLKQKEKNLEDERKANIEFDKKLAQEEVWIRQGIKARRTRNEGRVRDLKKLRATRAQRRELISKPSFNISSSELSGKLVSEIKNVTYGFSDGEDIVKNFSSTIIRGDRIGIVGPNGCGKTTLLKLILKQLEPNSGTVKLGTNINLAYFDQLREQVDTELTVAENVAGGRTSIEIGGKSKHIISYLGDFLFTPDRARSKVSKLSGGEYNRLLLAKLFSFDNNVLVLDEPTNDLDIETLELLEEILVNYKGTILLVSHDRLFMDNVITQLYAFEGKGKVTEYVGSYTDWIQHKQNISSDADEKQKNNVKQKENKSRNKKSNTNIKELDKVLRKIEKLEIELENVHEQIGAPEFYQKSKEHTEPVLAKSKEIQLELKKLYAKWEELE